MWDNLLSCSSTCFSGTEIYSYSLCSSKPACLLVYLFIYRLLQIWPLIPTGAFGMNSDASSLICIFIILFCCYFGTGVIVDAVAILNTRFTACHQSLLLHLSTLFFYFPVSWKLRKYCWMNPYGKVAQTLHTSHPIPDKPPNPVGTLHRLRKFNVPECLRV